MNIIRAGTCFLLLDASPHLHLWVTLTDPIGAQPEVLAVMLATARKYTDDTVILVAGDHPFIKHDTSVQYSTAKFMRVNRIIAEMHRHQCHLREDLAADVLIRVQKGLVDSPRTVNHVRDRFSEWLENIR